MIEQITADTYNTLGTRIHKISNRTHAARRQYGTFFCPPFASHLTKPNEGSVEDEQSGQATSPQTVSGYRHPPPPSHFCSLLFSSFIILIFLVSVFNPLPPPPCILAQEFRPPTPVLPTTLHYPAQTLTSSCLALPTTTTITHCHQPQQIAPLWLFSTSGKQRHTFRSQEVVVQGISFFAFPPLSLR